MNNAIPIAEGGLLVAILAAGAASRFGGGKLDRECAGERVGAWAIAATKEAGLPRGIIVTPPKPPLFAQEAHGWHCVVNPDPARGIGSSASLAAEAAKEANASALLLLLADMPLVEPNFLAMLVASEAPAATRYPGGRAGVPVLLPATMFAEAAKLSGDTGLGPLLSKREGIALLDPSASMLLDIDLPEDLAEAEALLAARQPS